METKNAIEDGIVLSQSVSGSRVEEGTTITIKVGKYNKQNGNVVDDNNSPNEDAGVTTPGDNNDDNNSDANTPGNDQNNNGNAGNNGNSGDSSPTPEENTPEGPWDDPSLNQSGQ